MRTLICFPVEDTPGLHAEAAQLALGLAHDDHEVIALGTLGPWRHVLRLAGLTATEFDLHSDQRRLTRQVQECDPQVIHAFGAGAAHLMLPLTPLVGAGGVVTLGHEDLGRISPVQFRTASAVFVPCDHLRELVARRLPAVTVVTTGYLLPPAEEAAPAADPFRAEQLGVADGAPLVLLADRLTGEEAGTALALIEAMPLIASRVPGVQALIAGDGARLDELEARASQVNEQLGYRALLLPGHCDDIRPLLALATVAVGSGRFAMEAASAGVALVAAGGAGLLGTYTPETASVAEFTCCGRHGVLDKLTPRALATEIVGLFTYPQYREQFATEGRAAVLATCERGARAAQMTAYYARTAPSGAVARAPQRVMAVLPDDLRDLLSVLPALGGLHAQYPLAQVDCMAARQHCALLRQLNLLGRVLEKPRLLREWPRLLRALWHPRPDVALCFTGETTDMLAAACTGAPMRLAAADGPLAPLFSDHLSGHGPLSPAQALKVMHALGVSTPAQVEPPVVPAETKEVIVQSLLAGGVEYTEPLILLYPQAEDARRWPREYWAELARLLTERQYDRVVVVGVDEFPLPDGVVPIMPVQDSLVLATLLARAAVVVAADTGALHLANLLGVPTVGLYGPTAPEAHPLLQNDTASALCHAEYPCHPCGDAPCADRHCLHALTPADVADAVLTLHTASHAE